VRFAALAEMDISQPETLAQHLHRAAYNQHHSRRDPLAEIAESLLVLRPRVVLETLYGSCPDGLLGLLRRLDASPVDRDLYRAAHTIFSDPRPSSKSRDSAPNARIDHRYKLSILSRLDPILVHKGLVNRLYDAGVQVEGPPCVPWP
jgi:hypothetical protein